MTAPPDETCAVLFVAGIVSPRPAVEHLRQSAPHVDTLFFSDHHDFTPADVETIRRKFAAMNFPHKRIVVTEKDASRLLTGGRYPDELRAHTYALPIEVAFLDGTDHAFTQKITQYVAENSRIS